MILQSIDGERERERRHRLCMVRCCKLLKERIKERMDVNSQQRRRIGDEHCCIVLECLPLRRCNKHSDSVWGILLDELIVEILCRLPQKALIRFKCVSKHWHSLISEVCVPRISPLPLSGILKIFWRRNRDIVGEYASILTQNPLDQKLLRDRPWDNLPGSLIHAFSPKASELHDICNGLCLYFRHSINLYCIWNFTTQQFVLFPPPPPPAAAAVSPSFGFEHNEREEIENKGYNCIIFSALAFDPKESPHFKVVRFDNENPALSPGVSPLRIFSSETREWLEYIVDIGPPTIDAASLVDHCVYLNHALYRLSKSLHLLRYDLEKNVNVTAIKLPYFESWTAESTFDDLGCIGSSLGRHLCYARNDANKVLIWILCDRNDAHNWVLMHSITSQDLINYELSIDCVVPMMVRNRLLGSVDNLGMLKLNRFVKEFLPQLKPVGFDPTSNAIILCALDITLRYHPDNKKLEVISSHKFMGHYASGAIPYEVFPFSQCLVPLKDLGWNHHRQDAGYKHNGW